MVVILAVYKLNLIYYFLNLKHKLYDFIKNILIDKIQKVNCKIIIYPLVFYID